MIPLGVLAGSRHGLHTPDNTYIWTPEGLTPDTPLQEVPGWTAQNGYNIATDGLGGTYLYHMRSGGGFNATYHASWLTPGVLTDVDVTAEVWGVATATHLTIGPRVRAPEAGNSYYAQHNSYQALITGSSLNIFLQGPEQSIDQRVELGSSPLPVSPSYMDRWYIRLQAVGTTLNAKAWPKQTPEPETWLVTAEDATYASGYVGFSGFGRGTDSRAAWSLRVTDLAS